MTDKIYVDTSNLNWWIEYECEQEEFVVIVTDIHIGLVGLPHDLNGVITEDLQDFFEEELIEHLTDTKKRPVFLDRHVDEMAV